MTRGQTAQISRRFSAAALGYDEADGIQRIVAEDLMQEALQRVKSPPAAILDIGCGTGRMAALARKIWPDAAITALDAAQGMLEATRRKIPDARLVLGDASALDLPPSSFDLILSSMALQWMPEPLAALRRWKGWLKPQGAMAVALPLEGSLKEWKDLCDRAGIPSGLWPLPKADFAAELILPPDRPEKEPAAATAAAGEKWQAALQTYAVEYPSAIEFLRRLKAVGASTPNATHAPAKASSLRRTLSSAPKPFRVGYVVGMVRIVG